MRKHICDGPTYVDTRLRCEDVDGLSARSESKRAKKRSGFPARADRTMSGRKAKRKERKRRESRFVPKKARHNVCDSTLRSPL